MYAVEKWIVDRSRPLHVLLVYTGDPDHHITLSRYTPHSQEDYDLAVHRLRRDGARPKHTPHGVLLATSLAHFRSDYTIVKVPGGDFSAVKEQLYANINLLRMGCSGRSALALDEPSDSTKDRFLSAYLLHLPPNRGKDRACFTSTVLELVKLIQAGLAVFDCYGSFATSNPSLILDGLLCDATVEGIHRWISDIGEPCLGLEPTERVADPSFVSALLSMVLSIRNRLATLVSSSPSGISLIPVPKDPFVYPYAFCMSLMTYLQHANTTAAAAASTSASASSSPVPTAFHTTQMAPFVVTSFANPYPPSAPVQPPAPPKPPVGTALSREIIEHIDTAYDKAKAIENKRVRRVLKGKFDDLTRSSTTPTHHESDGDHAHTHGDHAHNLSLSRGGGALSDSDAPHHHHHHHHLLGASPANSIGSSSGNRVLGGISTLLLPGNTSLSAGSSSSGQQGGGAGSIVEPIISLSAFLSVALSKETREGSSFASGRRANLKRIRGSVGGSISGVASSGGGGTASSGGELSHHHHQKSGKGLVGKSKRQRESVDMGLFYSVGGMAGAAGVVPLVTPNMSASASGTNPTTTVDNSLVVASPGVDTKLDWEVKEKEIVVGGSVKALWSGRVMDLVKMREWCEDVAHLHGVTNSALIVPSSTFQNTNGSSSSQRAVSGSTLGSTHSHTGSTSKFGKRKEKKKTSDRGSTLSPPTLLSVHSDRDGDPNKSDTGRSTEGEGEESESIVTTAHPNHPQLSGNPLASASFGSLLGGRVRGKLGTWAGLANRSKKGSSPSVDYGGGAGASPSPPALRVTTQSMPPQTSSADVGAGAGMSPIASMSRRNLGVAGDTSTARPSGTRGMSAPLLSSGLSKQQDTVDLSGVTSDDADVFDEESGVVGSGSGRKRRPKQLSLTLKAKQKIKRESTNTTTSSGGPQSPTLPPMVYPGDVSGTAGQLMSEPEDEFFEGEVLSSGQISPLSAYQSHFFSFTFSFRKKSNNDLTKNLPSTYNQATTDHTTRSSPPPRAPARRSQGISLSPSHRIHNHQDLSMGTTKTATTSASHPSTKSSPASPPAAVQEPQRHQEEEGPRAPEAPKRTSFTTAQAASRAQHVSHSCTKRNPHRPTCLTPPLPVAEA